MNSHLLFRRSEYRFLALAKPRDHHRVRSSTSHLWVRLHPLNQPTDSRLGIDKNLRVSYVRRSDSGKITGSVYALVKNGPEVGL